MAVTWTAGVDRPTGTLMTAAIVNSYLGTNGSLNYLKQKELWVPCTVANLTGGTVPSPLEGIGGMPGAKLIVADDEAAIGFKCPYDFVAIISAFVVVNPRASQASANWDVYTSYGTIGQAYTTHSANDTTTTYNVTLSQLYGVNIASLLSSLAAEDIVGIRFVLSDSAHDVTVLGFYMKYN